MMRVLLVVCALLLPITASAKRHKPKRHKAKVTRVAKHQVVQAPREEPKPPPKAVVAQATVASASRGEMVQQVWDDEVPGRPRK
jgi:hypothetical protein